MKQDYFIYPAILEIDEDYCYTLTFPDFTAEKAMPVIYAPSKRQVLKQGKEFLALHIAYLLEEEVVLPKPSGIDQPSIKSGQKVIQLDISLNNYEELIQVHKNSRHFHPGYYENDEVIEGIAVKNEHGNWEVFFDDFLDPGLFDNNVVRNDDYGGLLFIAENSKKVDERFYTWVKTVLLPYRKQ